MALGNRLTPKNTAAIEKGLKMAVTERGFIAPSETPQYNDGLLNGELHGQRRQDTLVYIYEGGFNKGIKHGKGTYTYQDGSTFSTQFENGKIYGTSTFIAPDKKRYTCIPIAGIDKAILMWENNNRVCIGKWGKKERPELFNGTFIEPCPKGSIPSKALPYTFKPGTRLLDISSDPGPHTELLAKIGYVYFKLDLDRLRTSSPDVQESLLVGLLSRNYWVSETSHLKYAVKALPGYTNKKMQYFLMLEKRTGDIAGAIFSRSKVNDVVKFVSVTMDEKFRGLGLGGLLLTMTIRRLQQDTGSRDFALYTSGEACTWYPKYGFRKIRDDPGCRDLTLSFNSRNQNNVFDRKELELTSKIRSSITEPPKTVRKILSVAYSAFITLEKAAVALLGYFLLSAT